MHESLANVPGEADFETEEWVPVPRSGSRLVSDFARAHILVGIFNGDPEAWLEFILREGTPEERENDLPWVQAIRRRMSDDPELLDRMRWLLQEWSATFPG